MEINTAMVEGFYSRYISRDLADLSGGGLFIVIIWYSLRNEFLPFIWKEPWEQSLMLISFLAVSYFVGFTFDKIGDHIPKYSPRLNLPSNYKSGLVLRQDLIGKYHVRILDQLERYVLLWILGKSVGLSAFIGFIIMVIIKIPYINDIIIRLPHINIDSSPYYWIFAIILLVFGLCMLKFGRDSWIQYYEEQKFLIEAIRNKNDFHEGYF